MKPTKSDIKASKKFTPHRTWQRVFAIGRAFGREVERKRTIRILKQIDDDPSVSHSVGYAMSKIKGNK